jgi:NAD-dependent SIR2 family protein deacetylase
VGEDEPVQSSSTVTAAAIDAGRDVRTDADATALHAAQIAGLVAAGGVVVLSGAGLSTESGIPDYRGASASQRRYSPMTGQAFRDDVAARRRYWARSHLGWQTIVRAAPNSGHLAVAELQRRGTVSAVVTQNVDGLHTVAGARDVIDLHGRLDRVICLGCGTTSSRSALHERLTDANPDWRTEVLAVNPDGDVDLSDDALDSFVVLDCEVCDGLLKPDVVYFGENVPAGRVAAAYDAVDSARVLLVLGSSLTVFSGRRFVVRAAKAGTTVVIVNAGPTRGDDLAALKVDAPLGATLTRLVADLDTGAPG